MAEERIRPYTGNVEHRGAVPVSPPVTPPVLPAAAAGHASAGCASTSHTKSLRSQDVQTHPTPFR